MPPSLLPFKASGPPKGCLKTWKSRAEAVARMNLISLEVRRKRTRADTGRPLSQASDGGSTICWEVEVTSVVYTKRRRARKWHPASLSSERGCFVVAEGNNRSFRHRFEAVECLTQCSTRSLRAGVCRGCRGPTKDRLKWRREFCYSALRMKKRHSRILLAASLLFFALAASKGQTNTIIVPKEQAKKFGNTFAPLDYQFQQLYSPALFADIASEVIAITEIAFRWDETFNQDRDAVIRGALFHMGVSSSPSNDFYQNLPHPVLVISAHEAYFPVSKNRGPDIFDVRFPLERPFVYDRRRGSLILQGAVSQSPDFDGQGAASRGVFLYREESGRIVSLPTIMITKFFYRTLPQIISINLVAGAIQIDIAGPEGKLQLEVAANVAGPYSAEPKAQLVRISTDIVQARIPIEDRNDRNRFFRVNYPDL